MGFEIEYLKALNPITLMVKLWGPTYPTFLYDVTLFSLFFLTLPLENKIDLLDSSLKYSDKETLKKSIKWLSLIIEAQYNIDYHLDAIFLCHNAAVALQNKKAVNHWAKLGSKIATVSRGEYSRNAMYFNASLK